MMNRWICLGGLVALATTGVLAQNEEPPRNPPGAPAPNEGNDPLSFYRQNPELMKRYFPHLVNGQGAGQAPATAPGPRSAVSGRYGGGYNKVEPGPAEVIKSINFGGGTARQLVSELKEHLNTRPNIMVSEKTADVKVPPFALENVSLADLFQALNALSEDKTAQWQLSGNGEPIWVLNSVAPDFTNIDPLTGRPISNAPSRTCQVLAVGKYLPRYKIEDITTAVKTAWNMTGQESGAQMKYHKDTELLIVVGSNEQIGIVNQVLNSLDLGMRDTKGKTGGGMEKSDGRP